MIIIILCRFLVQHDSNPIECLNAGTIKPTARVTLLHTQVGYSWIVESNVYISAARTQEVIVHCVFYHYYHFFKISIFFNKRQRNNEKKAYLLDKHILVIVVLMLDVVYVVIVEDVIHHDVIVVFQPLVMIIFLQHLLHL